MKKRWIFVPLLVVAVALGITGGTVLAHEGSTSGSSPIDSLTSKVATILGLDATAVQNAFQQVAKQAQDEALQKRLAKLVEKGRLTQAEADAYLQWYQSRPAGLIAGLPFGGLDPFGKHRFHGGWMMRGWGDHQVFPEATPQSTGTSA